MEWNSEHTQLQLTCVTGAAQSMALPTVILLYPSMVVIVADPSSDALLV